MHPHGVESCIWIYFGIKQRTENREFWKRGLSNKTKTKKYSKLEWRGQQTNKQTNKQLNKQKQNQNKCTKY